jgi:hypothetical protein
MIEIIALSLLALSIAACFLSPSQQKLALDSLHVPEDSMLRRHFLTHLRAEDARLAAALEKRLARAR